MKSSELFNWAKEYLAQGFSVIPILIIPDEDRKVSLINWKQYQQSPPTLEQLKKWFIDLDFPENKLKTLKKEKNKIGLAVVTGVVSGSLVVIDIDSKEAHSNFLSELYEWNEEIYRKLIESWSVETGKGVHYYFRVKDPDLKLFTNKIGIREDIDVRAEGGYVVAPPSPHPTGKVYRFRNKPEKISELTWEEYLSLIRFLEGDGSASLEDFPHYLGENGSRGKPTGREILGILNLLRPIYRPGNRNYLIHYLSGWLKKAGVDFESAKKIVELLAEEDEEKGQRIYVLERTYGKKGVKLKEEDLKGKSGIQEIAEKELGEEKALELVRRLEEILGKASPYNDSVFSLIDYSRRMYYVANPNRGVIARAMEDPKSGGIIYKELIAECCPVDVTVFEDPLGGVRKFQIAFTGLFSRTIGPADIDTITSRLQAEGVVKHRRLIQDALSSLVTAFLRNGKAEIREELEKPGFYYLDGELKVVKWDPEDFIKEDLQRSLTLLSELREKWYSHLEDRFTTVIKWGMIAPFSYAIKQIRGSYGIHFPWLLLHGSALTGKSTLGKINRAIWNLSLDEKGGSHIDTIPRFGKVISDSTFPILINEVADVLVKDSLREILKSSIETLFARGRYVQGVYVEEPALSSMVFTTNKTYPSDDALLRRFVGILFSVSDRISEEQAEEFQREVLPRLYDLKYLGYFVLDKIRKNPKLLTKDWLDLSTNLLREAFEYAEMEIPDWIHEEYRGESLEDITEAVNEEIRAVLLNEINQLFSRHISRIVHDENTELDRSPSFNVESRLNALLNQGLIPWARGKKGSIILERSVLKVLDGLAVDSLKSLADRFGWEYGNIKVNGSQGRRIQVKISDFVRFLSGESEEEENSRDVLLDEEWDLSGVRI
jgi:hypothetical protein